MSILLTDTAASASAAAIRSTATPIPIAIPFQVSGLIAPPLSLDGLVDFLAMDWDVCWGGDSDPHIRASHVLDADDDVIANENPLADSPC
jgi:hypothetical protein